MRILLGFCLVALVAVSAFTPANTSPQYGGWFGGYGYRARDAAKRAGNYVRGAYQGSKDMYRAYSDMKEANYLYSDRYFHARGNRDAARRGAGGVFAAKTLSNLREWSDRTFKGDSAADSARDQEANRWGRNGGDPDRFRPKGLPRRY